ncbi:orotate phosphoribosyltransferase [Caldalkalibacillus salinus]|uniref:orotate phosphoribosyltransferase n=1 Tax=Caldalkalibacillus salinus TaxID=2803787 RepID=UPI00192275E4|nr:orotate phosphoribosyltransferase [Caldalkalibacillus salinus]
MREEIAQVLLSIGAVELRPQDPFIWSSGIRSPIYCDNRLTMSYPHVRKRIADGLAKTIRDHFGPVDVVAGTATAGIPHAAWVSEQLGSPMLYVRSSAKGHGKQTQIEGKVVEGQRVIVIEDLISTGKSSLQAVKACRHAGLVVEGVVAIFSYNFDQALEAFEREDVPYRTLTDYHTLLAIAEKEGSLSAEDKQALSSWNPFSA